MNTLDSIKTLQLRQLFECSVDQYPNNTALICDDKIFSYQALEERANQLAHYLIQKGVTQEHCVGIFLERSPESYIAILAILKTGAAYVPLEVEYPDDRVNYILADMPFHSIITSSSQITDRTMIQFPQTITLDELESELVQQQSNRPELATPNEEQLCYVIYTSGSTGKPKGVEITNRSICHYVSVASNLYQMTPNDRVYQGFSLAFDASLEEVWMAFANGATLLACTSKDVRSGVGLIDFLNEQKATVFSTVPTVLSMLETNLPNLRLLILGGEACTAPLIKQWSRTGLRILNTYGPTEATVIATAAECYFDKPVTIGKALPGYEVLILDEQLQPVAIGQKGELCIAGHGLARGYVNQPDATEQKFIINPTNKNQRIYRTGDLAMVNSTGNIEFLGRIDSQIKLRGFRIELDEIEAVLTEHESISQAVVSLHESNQPMLVAYLLLNKKSTLDIRQLKDFLQKQLPHYMIPSQFEVVASFPLLSSGKVNRKALPKPGECPNQRDYAPPKTELEAEITSIWEASLLQRSISIDDDFFYDLGGHSLSAAKIVSNLRKSTKTKDISILDLYQNPTIRQLAEKFEHLKHYEQTDNQQSQKSRVTNFTYYLCGIGQFFGCLLQYAIRSWQFLTVVLCYSWLTVHENLFSSDTIFVFSALFLGIPISSMAITICMKWLLLGRVKPGAYKVWGWFYFRWWLVDRLQRNIFAPHHWVGSPIISVYYRLLGAKIGRNCYIGTANVAAHDMLTIGDNCSIGFDARLLGYVVEDGWLKIGPITIGDHCFVGSRSVVSIDTIMNDNSSLDDMSMLPIHRHIPSNQFFSGSPARQTTAAPDHIINQTSALDNTSPVKNFYFGVLHYICLVFVMLVYYICYLPALLLITYFHEQTHYLMTICVAAPFGAMIFLSLYYLALGACKKLLMNRIKPGVYSLKSLYYLRQWVIVKMIDVDEIYILADTLYFPYILRFLGAKLGKRVEMGETPHIIPDLITIQDEGFTATAVALAWPSVFQGQIKFAPVEIGHRGFVGNGSLLPSGSNIGDGGLLGCMTITPPNNQAASKHTAWLGSPAVFLPKRELFTEFSDSEKFTPPKRLVNIRLAIEFVRIMMPTTFNLITIFNLLYVLNILLSGYALTTTVVVLPIAASFITLGLVSTIVLLKWLILGKLKPATKPMWNVFIWKNDVIAYLYNYFIASHMMNIVLGTPFASLLLRSFGAKIGKRAFIHTAYFTEFDLISIGNEVNLNADMIVQTHLYEDRIFKMSTVNINDGCNVGVASIALYNTVMDQNSTLGNFSLLMKGETLPQNTNWQGIPAQPMRAHDNDQLNSESLLPTKDLLILDID